MGESSSTARGVVGRARDFVKGRPASQKVGGGVAAALLATAPFGGLDTAEQPGPAEVTLDKAFQTGPYEVVIDQVVELPDLAPAVTPEPGERVIVLDATVTNTSDRPDYAILLADQLDISGGGVEVDKGRTPRRPTVVVVDDGTTLQVLNPGVPYRLAIVYTTTGTWQGDSLDLTVNRLEFVVEDSLTLDDYTWRERDGVEWRGTLPVVRKK